MRIPSNIIQTGKYTIGKEFIDKKTHKFYQGYYYEINGRWFAGKEFNNNAPEIIKISSLASNSLFSLGLMLFKKFSKLNIDPNKPSSFFYNYQDNIRYFLSKNNVFPISITEVNEETFKKFKNNPIYSSAILTYDGGFNNVELKEAEKKIPGITTFVSTSYLPPPVEEDGSIG
jgi:hypothetical protein